jgi:hypothetical protein
MLKTIRVAVLMLVLGLSCAGCILLPAAYGGFGVYSATSAAAKDKANAGKGPPPEATPEATPPKP